MHAEMNIFNIFGNVSFGSSKFGIANKNDLAFIITSKSFQFSSLFLFNLFFQEERSSDRKIWRMIEQLGCSNAVNPFQALCEVLSQEGHALLANELRTDLQAERGSLVLDDDVKNETAILVHRSLL